MACCVRFLKTVLGTDGHPFTVLQRTIKVEESGSADETIALAKKRFAELEGMPDWQLHADMVELQSDRDVGSVSEVTMVHGRVRCPKRMPAKRRRDLRAAR